MSRFLSAALLFSLAFGVAGFAFAADKGEKKSPEDVFKAHDKNSDGKLSLDEFVGKKKDQAKEKAEAAFKQKDKDNDGFLTLEEFKGGKKKDAK